MPTLTMNPTLGDVLKWEADRGHARETALLKSGNNLKIGHILGIEAVDPTAGNVTAAAVAGGTGNGTITKAATPVLPNAVPGIYRAICTVAAVNGGTFEVINPLGETIGLATVGTAFGTEIAFTIADGATDFAVGDSFTIEVPAGTGKLVPIASVPAANGSHRFAGVLLTDTDATSADANCLYLARGPAILAADRLTWPAYFDTAIKKAGVLAQMARAGILVRTTA